MGLDVTEGVGKTGVVASLTVGDGKKVIGIRADMDAINLTEASTHDHISKNAGKMHACGHDGHTVTLLGAAKLLSESKDFSGTVRFIFQPAEEPGYGAKAMLEDGLLERFPMDEIYGLHNAPSLRAGVICTKPGPIMASEDNFTVKITGRGCHASAPHMGIDPFAAAAEIYLALQTVVSRSVNPLHPAVVSVTEVYMDGAHNAIPSHVELRGDTRSYSTEDSALIEKRMREICLGVCALNGATCEFTYTHEFYPTINDKACTMAALEAAVHTVGAENVNGDCEPLTASEDFALFLREVPGCYLFLGSAKDRDPSKIAPLHNATFDYNDDVLTVGAAFWARLARERLV
ncbi:Hippurate hydrolase [bioreactor metagenome]|uniref:Hippurate hydrolase n=1 Tax=bioreactor metagenome TaxID=1076179 RepID=A0A644XYJ2_9ZZZZ